MGLFVNLFFDALKENAFQFTDHQQQAFVRLKTVMSTPPILTLSDFSESFICRWQ